MIPLSNLNGSLFQTKPSRNHVSQPQGNEEKCFRESLNHLVWPELFKYISLYLTTSKCKIKTMLMAVYFFPPLRGCLVMGFVMAASLECGRKLKHLPSNQKGEVLSEGCPVISDLLNIAGDALTTVIIGRKKNTTPTWTLGTGHSD